MTDPKYHAVVKFGEGVPADVQGPALLAMEKMLRASTGLPIEVFKPYHADDSKLRLNMTPEKRATL
jgi:hypothetical protein